MRLFAIVFLLLPIFCHAAGSDSTPLLATVKNFYSWVLKNGEATQNLAPKIVEVPNSTRFQLETFTLKPFSEKMMASGVFAPSFPKAVEKYYANHQTTFANIPQKDFDEIAKFGRGPMMEVENMYIFFCAQEYEYTPQFVEKLHIKKYNLKCSSAWAVVESPYGWPTTFYLKKIKQQWLISGYCVFK